jgi:membrane protein implicated in regulation of membrane protease activity
VDFYTFIQSPPGLQLLNAVTLLIAAVAAYLSHKARESADGARQQSERNHELLDGHLAQHVQDASNQNKHSD